MLSVIALAVFVSLGPEGHSTIGAATEAFEEVLPLGSWTEGFRAAAVAFQGHLYDVEEIVAHEGLMGAWQDLPFVPDESRIEGIMKNGAHRGSGEEPRPCLQVPVGI